MKYFTHLFLLTVFTCSLALNTTETQAQDRGKGFGIGVIIGEPTGISVKSWLSDRSALAAVAAWSFGGRNTVHFHLDYQVHNYDLVTVEQGRMSFYWGLGGRIIVREGDRDNILSARIPLGLNYHIQGSRLETFVEAVPKVNLIPSTGFDVGAGLGIRYFF